MVRHAEADIDLCPVGRRAARGQERGGPVTGAFPPKSRAQARWAPGWTFQGGTPHVRVLLNEPAAQEQLENPLKVFNSCQRELVSKNKPQNLEHEEKPAPAEAMRAAAAHQHRHTTKSDSPRPRGRPSPHILSAGKENSSLVTSGAASF